MLLINSIFVVVFILFFTLRTVYVFCIRYKIDIISRNVCKSVVRMTQVFDLEKMFYFEISSEKMTLHYAMIVF